MKQLFTGLALLSVFTMTMYGQKKTTPVSKKTPPVASPLKNLSDSFSYALGVTVANYYKQQGIKNLNAEILAKACNDVYANKKPAISDRSIDIIMMKTLAPDQYQKIGVNIEAGEKCLADNKKKPGLVTTPSGLQYEVITQGTGPRPTTADVVVCNYRGTFLNGTVFDDSYARGTPAEFAVTGVIKGWTEALQLMPVGSKYKLYVPYYLGYGVNDNPPITGGSLLVFEVELLSIKGK